MRKLLFFISLIFLLACDNERVEINNSGLQNYTGSWQINKYYYNSGINGLYEGDCIISDPIIINYSLNQIQIPSECNLNTPYHLIFDVDTDGSLYNFENYNLLDSYMMLDSVSIQTINISDSDGIDSISIYFRHYVPNGMYVTHIKGRKLDK